MVGCPLNNILLKFYLENCQKNFLVYKSKYTKVVWQWGFWRFRTLECNKTPKNRGNDYGVGLIGEMIK